MQLGRKYLIAKLGPQPHRHMQPSPSSSQEMFIGVSLVVSPIANGVSSTSFV